MLDYPVFHNRTDSGLLYIIFSELTLNGIAKIIVCNVAKYILPIVKCIIKRKYLFKWLVFWILLKCDLFCDQSCIFSIITAVFSVTRSSEIILICWFAAQFLSVVIGAQLLIGLIVIITIVKHSFCCLNFLLKTGTKKKYLNYSKLLTVIVIVWMWIEFVDILVKGIAGGITK